VKKIYLTLTCLIFVLSACTSPGPTEVATQALPTNTDVPPDPTAPVEPLSATPEPTPFFQVYSDQPIVPNGVDGTWDDRYTDPGAVVYHDGIFHMFRNGFRAFPAESQVGYVTSPDGYEWTKQGDDPIFKTSDVPYAKIAMYASSALVEADGTWVMYFYTWDSKDFPSASVIGRATAKSPTGPWGADAGPVLVPGAMDEWDRKQVLAPHVIQTGDGYVMYYSGTNSAGVQMIGMATSRDGIQWTKYNDPSTTAAPFAESDPVFQPGEAGAWDASWVHQPRVFQTPEGWVMFYRGTQNKEGSIMKLGVATSGDGIHWERSPLNPLLKPSDVPHAQYFWFTNVLHTDDTYYLFWEVDIGRSTEIYLATHQGAIP